MLSDALSKLTSGFSEIFSKDEDLIGLDIGLSSVKVAEILVSKNGYKLNKYASVDLPEGAIDESEIQKEEEVVDAIIEAFNKAGIKSHSVSFGFYGPNAVVKRIQLAGGTEEEIDDQVSWDAEQYLPFSIEECSYDYQLISENEGGGVDVVVAAVKNDVIEKYNEIFALSKVKLKVGDLNAIAIANVFEFCYADKIEDETSSWIILEYGAQKTQFMIYKAGTIVFHKEIPVGGIMITEEIQRRMGVNYIEAEDLKCCPDENGNLPEEVIETINEVQESVFAEIHKAFDFYLTSSSDENIVGCAATGGALRSYGFLSGLEELFGVEINILNPFEGIDYNEKSFTEDEINTIAYTGAAVLGLGMRKG